MRFVGGPMSLIVLVAVGLLLAGGLMMIFRAWRGERSHERPVTCGRCRSSNPGHARYCGHCGQIVASVSSAESKD